MSQTLHLLTAFRNEEKSIVTLLDELHQILQHGDLLSKVRLTMVDDLSFDNSVDLIQTWQQEHPELLIDLISCPTNLGNQGALTYGLQKMDVGENDIVLSFDSDGEDDISKIPLILSTADQNPNCIIFTERGHRYNGTFFNILFRIFAWTIKFLTQKPLLPNNFLLFPGKYHNAISSSPFLPAYYALSILRLNFPYRSLILDRRPRIDGVSSQNIYNLITHAFIGLLIFHETVIAKLYTWLFASVGVFTFTSFFALFVKFVKEKALPGWTAMFITINFGFMGFTLLMLCVIAFLSMVLKLLSYHLPQMVVDQKKLS